MSLTSLQGTVCLVQTRLGTRTLSAHTHGLLADCSTHDQVLHRKYEALAAHWFSIERPSHLRGFRHPSMWHLHQGPQIPYVYKCELLRGVNLSPRKAMAKATPETVRIRWRWVSVYLSTYYLLYRKHVEQRTLHTTASSSHLGSAKVLGCNPTTVQMPTDCWQRSRRGVNRKILGDQFEKFKDLQFTLQTTTSLCRGEEAARERPLAVLLASVSTEDRAAQKVPSRGQTTPSHTSAQ